MDCSHYTDGEHRFGSNNYCTCGCVLTNTDRRNRDLAEDAAVLLSGKSTLKEARPPKVSVPDRLTKLGDIYRERNAIYGDTYRNFGKVMMGFFPKGLSLSTEEQWNKVALFFHCADKLAREAASLPDGFHEDSLSDLSVYSMMLQEYSEDVKKDK